jgi:hypothetical protein
MGHEPGVSDLLTDWAAALVALLKHPTDGLGIKILDGYRDGISTEEDIGCVFSPGFGEYGADVNFANPLMVVRVWKRRSQEPSQNKPAPPAPLYALAWRIAQILEPVQATLIDDFYFRATAARIDHPDQGVEVTLLGFVRNPATVEP